MIAPKNIGTTKLFVRPNLATPALELVVDAADVVADVAADRAADVTDGVDDEIDVGVLVRVASNPLVLNENPAPVPAVWVAAKFE